MKHLTTEDKVHLEKRLTIEFLSDKKIEEIRKILNQYGSNGYDPEELRPFYERLEEQYLLNNVGYIHI